VTDGRLVRDSENLLKIVLVQGSARSCLLAPLLVESNDVVEEGW